MPVPSKSGLSPRSVNAVQMKPKRQRRKVLVEKIGFGDLTKS